MEDVAWLWWLDSLVCSCLSVLCAAPLGCAVLHREPRSAPVSLGLRPHSHLGHREKECADLMMYRKSEEPHNDPGTAIGQHCASESPAHSELEPHTKGMWRHSMWIHSESVCMGTCSALLRSRLFDFSSHLCRGRGGLSEARQRAGGLKLSARSSNPLKADGKLVGGTEGLRTEADCHKWLQLLLRPWSWLQ